MSRCSVSGSGAPGRPGQGVSRVGQGSSVREGGAGWCAGWQDGPRAGADSDHRDGGPLLTGAGHHGVLKEWVRRPLQPPETHLLVHLL